MKLSFYGATQTVTGSKFLLEVNAKRLLIDCGLFQGVKMLRLRNRQKLPFDASTLDAVLLTHAHVDHSGYLPALYKNGFRGPTYCTAATADLLSILLPDAGHLQEEEARFRNKRGSTKHKPAQPLFTAEDAQATLQYLKIIENHGQLDLGDGIRAQFNRSGHILGSSTITIDDGARNILFSGDLGRPEDHLLPPPIRPTKVDYLVVESTYGLRKHGDEDVFQTLADIVNETHRRRGIVLMPAFAVGRTQTLIYLLNELKKRGDIPPLPIYLNSPMAMKVTSLLPKYVNRLKLNKAEVEELVHAVTYVCTPEDSKALVAKKDPAIILSASGMATGGRVLHHLKELLPNPRNAVVFAGFQAAGTRGHALVGGAEQVKIHGSYIPVQAQIHNVDGLSAHADYEEVLGWLQDVRRPPAKTFVVHGEPAAADAMRRHIGDHLGWEATVGVYGGEEVLL